MSERATRGGRAITEFLSQNEKAVFDRDSGHTFAPGFLLSLSDVTILVVGVAVARDAPGWSATVAVSLVATVAVVVVEMRKRSYHGIGWRRINPGVPDWRISGGANGSGG
jgi:hypothetical protein